MVANPESVGPSAGPGPHAHNFWASLTQAEQSAFAASARRRAFAPGSVLCREGEPADTVGVIQSGWTKVCVNNAGQERILAMRGPGDLIGERAVLILRSRSATVVALDSVEVLLIPAEDFAALLDDHPRLYAVLELQVYGRLTENSDPVVTNERIARFHSTLPDAQPSWAGQNCSILLTDIAAFGHRDRDDQDRLAVRRAMYEILRAGFKSSDVPWATFHWEDRGDGALIVVPPTVRTVSLVDPMLSRLAAALKRHNHQASSATRIQLRVALNVGPVDPDAEGVSGESIIHTARLLEAPTLKEQLATRGADLGFIVSTFVYDTVVKHNPGNVDSATFEQVSCQVKESDITAWMHLSGSRVARPRELRTNPSPPADTGSGSSVYLTVEGDFVAGDKFQFGAE